MSGNHRVSIVSHFLQIRMHKFVLWLKFGHSTGRGVAGLIVPRTNVLADVATENVMANAFTKLQRNLAAFFNGEVSDAAAGIHLAGCEDGLRRTCINTARAASTTVGSGNIRRQLQRCEHYAEKDP